ncbi:MAG: HAMP domain-containing sensor histidine kinase, partial [Alphaproteobacteria bacterium]|nr:HAMP domain-containing sensor histidine kinase [Alphaproteobacteria bacterium]
IQREGRLISEALAPAFEAFSAGQPERVQATLSQFENELMDLKVLVRPAASQSRNASYFYVGKTPLESRDYLEAELKKLLGTGVFDRFEGDCSGDRALAVRYRNPQDEPEILTSITPRSTDYGCWVLVTSHSQQPFIDSAIGQPFWARSDVQWALLIYLMMALTISVALVTIWNNLTTFRNTARRLAAGDQNVSFGRVNEIPELRGVASDFDHLVRALNSSRQMIKQAAEDNAHALKGPLAVMSQSLEPLRRLSPKDEQIERNLSRIERSLERLDTLVTMARDIEQSAADALNPVLETFDFSAFLETVVDEFRYSASEAGASIASDIEPDIRIKASEDLLETAVENILDNAIDYAGGATELRVSLHQEAGEAVLVIEDEGPGVATEHLHRIFDRYFREERPEQDGKRDRPKHEGIGLWVVRRNVEALSGRVWAESRDPSGLRVVMAFPREK